MRANNWLNLSKQQQINIFNQAGAQTGLPAFAIEKDAWVTLVLRMLFSSELSSHIVFKGGTSLSKVYGLIERFSEDIDLSINREYLGFGEDLTKGKIRKLRRASHSFSLNTLPDILEKQFDQYGIDGGLYDISVPNKKISDQDPEVVHINYESVFEEETYLENRVLIEIGARALNEPFEEKEIQAIIDEQFSESEFSDNPFLVKTIVPEKTFLEKMILLHEEFCKPTEKIKYNRMSRHLYDIEQIAGTEYGKRAMKDDQLFRDICNHRAVFTPVKVVEYDKLNLNDLEFIPPDDFIKQYWDDYSEMQSSMIYGDTLPFDELIKKLQKLK
jgi:hypothetical protein